MNVKHAVIGGVFCLLFGITSCENDLKEVERLSSRKTEAPVDISYGVTIIYSDSAVVKARMTTAKMLHYNTEDPYYEFPEGGLLIMYDSTLKEAQRVTCKYAIQRENTGITELRKDVVATRADGLVLKSEELIWDENQRKFYSNLPVVLIREGTIQNGTSFWANEDFSKYEFTSLVGDFHIGNEDDN